MDLHALRRVVIGFDETGRSAVLSDGHAPGARGHTTYACVSVVELDRTGPGRFYAVQIDPGEEIPLHATPTVDYHCVVGGEVTCLLEGGAEVTVRAGDVLVLQGNEHGWINRGNQPFQSVAVMVDADKE